MGIMINPENAIPCTVSFASTESLNDFKAQNCKVWKLFLDIWIQMYCFLTDSFASKIWLDTVNLSWVKVFLLIASY